MNVGNSLTRDLRSVSAREARLGNASAALTPHASSEIYLVRHAIAAERGDDWPDDTKRPLTEQGISRFKEAVGGLKALDVDHRRDLHQSPGPRPPDRRSARCRCPRTSTVKLLDALAPAARQQR